MLTPFARLVRLVLVVLLGGIGVGLCLAALVPGVRLLTATSRVDVEISLEELDERTTVYDVNGDVIATLGLIDRFPVDLEEVPQIVVDAVVAVEDRTFWDNPGVDVKSAFRAVLANVDEGEIAQGGSTITQQLVKKRVVGEKQDLDRKAREMVLALRLNEQYSKEEILQEYLNTVYFGQGAYGIQAAAERFFIFQGLDGNFYPKPLNELTLPDAALLAGLIQNPEGYNPFTNPDRARRRRTEVLERMREEGVITAAQEQEASSAPLPIIKPPQELRPDNYFVEEVQRRLLEDDKLGKTPQERRDKLLRGGLHVYTTYDAGAQAAAQAAVDQVVPNQPPFTASLAAIDPQNGEVRAIVGGPNFQQVQYNLATQGARQPGSTYKAVTLAAALEAGYTPNDVVDGSSPCSVPNPPLREPYLTRNAGDGGGSGHMTLTRATVGSVNCAYVRLISALGADKVADMAKRLGITSEVPAFLSITLGTAEATPLDMANVFATLVSGGIRHEASFVRRVLEADGTPLIEQGSTVGRRVVSAEIANTVVDILRGVVTGGTGTAAQLADRRPAAGKTGSTDEASDAWFCGVVPQLSACVWMGAPVGRVPMRNVGGVPTVFGGTYPARTWKAFMDVELAGVPVVDFPPPAPNFGQPGVIDDGKRFATDDYEEFQNSTTTTTAPPPPPSSSSTTTTPPTTTTPSTTTTTTAPPGPGGGGGPGG